MKNLFGIFTIAALMGLTFTSCNDNDYDYGDQIEQIRQQEVKIDSILTKEKGIIKSYVEQNYPNAQADTAKYPFQVLDKTTERGIYYQVLSEPTDDTFEYKLDASQTRVLYPTWKLKYSVRTLNGDKPFFEDTEGTNYNLTGQNAQKIFTQAWMIALFPAKYKVNGQDINFVGLLKNGAKKGSKIRLIVPSDFAYGTQGLSEKNVSANTPLVYEFEVLEVNY